MQNKHNSCWRHLLYLRPETGNYFAFQIIEIRRNLVYLLLDYFDDRPPTGDFQNETFIRQRWFWNDLRIRHVDANEL